MQNIFIFTLNDRYGFLNFWLSCQSLDSAPTIWGVDLWQCLKLWRGPKGGIFLYLWGFPPRLGERKFSGPTGILKEVGNGKKHCPFERFFPLRIPWKVGGIRDPGCGRNPRREAPLAGDFSTLGAGRSKGNPL